MLTYILIGLIWTSSIQSSPIQTPNLKTSHLVFYRQPSSQYVPQNLFLQYPGNAEPSTFGKALQGVPSPNEILFYPNSGQVTQQPQQVLVNPQLANISPATKFTAPPTGLVNAIYAWFAENNIPAPDDPTKNDATQERIEIANDQDKIENPEKNPAPTVGEAEVLAEADKNPNFLFPKKPAPKYNPGRFYILNGQPQFFGNYQPILPRLQPVIPQLFTRNNVPSDPQNILILQPQVDLQQANLKSPAVRHQEQEAQNVVLLRNNLRGDQISNIQPEIMKPVRYHSQDLKPQNFVFLRETPQNEQQLQVQPLLQTYSRQQLLIGRLLPQSHEIKQQQVQNSPVHQTHYVPVEVVPPQVPIQHTAHLQYHNEEIPQQDINQQQLSFIHIPVDRNVQPPQYIKSSIPLQINEKSQIQGIPTTHPLQNQQHNQQFLYLNPEAQDQLLGQRLGLIQQDQLQQKQQQQQQQLQQQQQQQQQQQLQLQQHQQEQIQRDQIQHTHIQQVQDLPTTGIEEQIHQQQIAKQQPQQHQQQQQQQQQEQPSGSNDVPPGVAALEFARYIASKHGDLYSDTVVIDAKSSEEDKTQTGHESESSEEIHADVAEEPSLAQAQPSGVALAGTGGVAATAPRGTALVGDKGLAVASPHATAVAGPEKSNKDKKTT